MLNDAAESHKRPFYQAKAPNKKFERMREI
jgi:hypothetical protein